MFIKKVPKIIPPRSRVRLLRADRRTPAWEKANGRQFRIGYYRRKDGLDCIWLVNENGTYEQTTDRAFLLKYFDVEQLSQERNFYGRGKRRLRKIHVPTPLERLTATSSIEAYEGAKEILQEDDPKVVRPVVNVLLHGKRVLNRAAAAYALHLPRGNAAVLALEKTVANKREHPKVRGQAAESLAFNHREESHGILRANLHDPSKEVRFWCAYSLAEMADDDAIVPLKRLAEEDHRVVKGFWSVSKEAKWAIRVIRKEMTERKRRRKLCIYCSKTRTSLSYRVSHA